MVCFRNVELACAYSTKFMRAKDGAQTRDPQLGRLMLYQLSYFRNNKYYILYFSCSAIILSAAMAQSSPLLP